MVGGDIGSGCLVGGVSVFFSGTVGFPGSFTIPGVGFLLEFGYVAFICPAVANGVPVQICSWQACGLRQ